MIDAKIAIFANLRRLLAFDALLSWQKGVCLRCANACSQPGVVSEANGICLKDALQTLCFKTYIRGCQPSSAAIGFGCIVMTKRNAQGESRRATPSTLLWDKGMSPLPSHRKMSGNEISPRSVSESPARHIAFSEVWEFMVISRSHRVKSYQRPCQWLHYPKVVLQSRMLFGKIRHSRDWRPVLFGNQASL